LIDVVSIDSSPHQYVHFVVNIIITHELWFQQRYGENAGQLLDSNEALLKASASGQSSGYLLNL
jgi:hypothetical protein